MPRLSKVFLPLIGSFVAGSFVHFLGSDRSTTPELILLFFLLLLSSLVSRSTKRKRSVILLFLIFFISFFFYFLRIYLLSRLDVILAYLFSFVLVSSVGGGQGLPLKSSKIPKAAPRVLYTKQDKSIQVRQGRIRARRTVILYFRGQSIGCPPIYLVSLFIRNNLCHSYCPGFKKEAWIGDSCVNIQVDNQLSRQPVDSETNTNDFAGSKNNIA